MNDRNSSYYIRDKSRSDGKRLGVCRICLQKKKLSDDHVPPKICQYNKDDANQVSQTLLSLLKSNSERTSFKTFQGGIKFRSICEKCNNMIGQKYDPSLGDFVSSIREIIESKIIPPENIKIKGNSDRVIRAIFGHLLAANPSTHDSLFDSTVRKSILDETVPIPSNFHVLFWIYPYKRTIIIRDALISDLSGKFEHAFVQIIKFYPIAFVVTDEKNFYSANRIEPSLQIRTQQNSIELKTNYVAGEFFPEAPTDNRVIFFGKSANNSIIARPKNTAESKKRRRKKT